MVLYFEDVSEGSESYCRDSFSSCSEHIDVWSESGSDLEEEIFEEQSKNVIFAFEAIGCLGETDISRSLRNTKFLLELAAPETLLVCLELVSQCT